MENKNKTGVPAENTGNHENAAMNGLNVALDVLKMLGVDGESEKTEPKRTQESESAIPEEPASDEEITDGEGEESAVEETIAPEAELASDEDEDVKIFGAPTKTFKKTPTFEEKAPEEKTEESTSPQIGFSFFEEEDGDSTETPVDFAVDGDAFDAVENASSDTDSATETPISDDEAESLLPSEAEQTSAPVEEAPTEEVSCGSEETATEAGEEDTSDGESFELLADTPEDLSDDIEETFEGETEDEGELFEDALSDEEYDTQSESASAEDTADAEEAAEAAPSEDDDPLKRLFYDSDGDGIPDAPIKRKRPRVGKQKSEKKEFWGAALGFNEEIDMSDAAAVKEASEAFDKRKANALISLVGAMVCFFLVLYTELAPGSGFLPHSDMMSAQNPVFYSLITLQLMFFGVMFVFDSLAKGVDRWLDHHVMTPAAIALVSTALATVQAVASATMGGAESLRLLCSLGSASLVMLALYDYLGASSDKRSFRTACVEHTKFGATEISLSGSEYASLRAGIADKSARAVTVTKGKAYKRFVERTSALPACERKLWIPMVVIFAVALLIGFISAVASKSVYIGISNAVLICLASTPLNLFITSALPRHVAVKRGKDVRATMVGPNAGAEFSRLSAVTFADTAVFNPNDTELESWLVSRTEKSPDIIFTMVKIFRHVGGPLALVFGKLLDNPDQELYSDVRLLAVHPNAIDVSVDGKSYTVATDKHLSGMGLRVKHHADDERYSLVYLLEGDVQLAKFRIEYRIDERFERTVSELDDVHISVGIKTITPGINDSFLRTMSELDGCNISVVKGNCEEDLPAAAPAFDSSIIALGSVHNFLEMLLLCENSVKRTRMNTGFFYVSTGLCLALSAWLILGGGLSNTILPVMFGLLVQAFWLILVALNSFLKK